MQQIKRTPCMCNSFAFLLNTEDRWTEDAMVRLVEDLGLVYESMEAE